MAHLTSASAPVGSIVFSLFALLAISLGVLLLLRYYLPLRTTPAFYLVPIFFALWLPAIIILLVPIDLASSAATDDEATRGIWLPHRVVLVSWRITYWLTFALTWYASSHAHFSPLILLWLTRAQVHSPHPSRVFRLGLPRASGQAQILPPSKCAILRPHLGRRPRRTALRRHRV